MIILGWGKGNFTWGMGVGASATYFTFTVCCRLRSASLLEIKSSRNDQPVPVRPFLLRYLNQPRYALIAPPTTDNDAFHNVHRGDCFNRRTQLWAIQAKLFLQI